MSLKMVIDGMSKKMVTQEMRRESRRKSRLDNHHYVIDADRGEVQRAFGKPKMKPKAVIYLPHYENSLRIEVELPEGKPDEVQEKLDDYKDKFINWFGGDGKKIPFMWGNKTRRYVYNKIALKIKGVKIPRAENRALRTLFMYKGLLNEFKKGKIRKSIVNDLAEHKKFQFEQTRRINKYSRKTGVILKTTRKPTTINRDISSLVKVGILKKVGKGRYEVNREQELELEQIDRMVIHEK
jgi:hypothetical protein